MKRILSLLLVMILVTFSACGAGDSAGTSDTSSADTSGTSDTSVKDASAEESSQESSESDLTLYYLDTSGYSLVEVEYETEATTASDLVPLIMEQLEKSDSEEGYRAVITEDFSVSAFSVNDEILTLYLTAGYNNLSGYSEVLIRSAMVKSFLNIDEISGVEFYVENTPLTDTSGNNVGIMTADSFLSDYVTDSNTPLSTTLTLYYATADGTKLQKVTTDAYYNVNSSLEQVVMFYLKVDPEESDAMAAISEETKVLRISVTDGICYVDLGSDFLSSTANVSTQVAVYSIVNSLCELDNINKVQLMVYSSDEEGSIDVTQINGLYEKNTDLVVEETDETSDDTELVDVSSGDSDSSN